jgi:ABC-2 type transport system ATP-binding protein
MSTHQMHQVEAMCNRIVLINEGQSVLYGEVDEIKRDYAANAVRIIGQGNLDDIPGVIEVHKENGEFHLVLDNQTNPQHMFNILAQRGDLTISKFEVAAPSLDDVFVSVVQEQIHSGAENG